MILDAVVTLDLPLVRLERRRRTLEELFHPNAGSATASAPATGNGGAESR